MNRTMQWTITFAFGTKGGEMKCKADDDRNTAETLSMKIERKKSKMITDRRRNVNRIAAWQILSTCKLNLRMLENISSRFSTIRYFIFVSFLRFFFSCFLFLSSLLSFLIIFCCCRETRFLLFCCLSQSRFVHFVMTSMEIYDEQRLL